MLVRRSRFRLSHGYLRGSSLSAVNFLILFLGRRPQMKQSRTTDEKNRADLTVARPINRRIGREMPGGKKPQVELTALLRRMRGGDSAAGQVFAREVYHELRQMAANLMWRERRNHTYQPTDLVNEVLGRFLGDGTIEHAADRRYFFASAARAMRRILIDHARQRQAQRRGGGLRRVPLDEMVEVFESERIDLVALDEALDALREVDQQAAECIALRLFCGLTNAEIAAQQGVSLSTIEREHRFARAFLNRALSGGRQDDTAAMGTRPKTVLDDHPEADT